MVLLFDCDDSRDTHLTPCISCSVVSQIVCLVYENCYALTSFFYEKMQRIEISV